MKSFLSAVNLHSEHLYRNFYAAIFVIAAMIFVGAMIYDPEGFLADDSQSYLTASYKSANGEIDILRPPVYPFVIALVRGIVGATHQITGVITLQYLLFMLSAAALHSILQRCGCRRLTSLCTTAFYALFPGFSLYCYTIGTEALAQAFVIFFVGSLLKNVNTLPRLSSPLLGALWLLLLIFLKPAMICLLPVYLFFWFIRLCQYRRAALSGFLTASCCLLLIVAALSGYSGEVKRQCQVEGTFSIVSVINDYYLVREAYALRPHHTPDPKLKKFIAEHADRPIVLPDGHVNFEEMHTIQDDLHISIAEIDRAVDSALKENPWARVTPLPARIYRSAGQFDLLPMLPSLAPYFPVKLLWFYLFMGFSLIWLLVKRRPSLRAWTLWLTSAAITGCALLGAMDDWTRLLLPAMPPTLMLAALLFSSLRSQDCNESNSKATYPLGKCLIPGLPGCDDSYR